MNEIFQNLIIQILKYKNKYKGKHKKDFEKEIKNMQVEVKHFFPGTFFIVLGVLSASFGLKGFLLPNSFIDGGLWEFLLS